MAEISEIVKGLIGPTTTNRFEKVETISMENISILDERVPDLTGGLPLTPGMKFKVLEVFEALVVNKATGKPAKANGEKSAFLACQADGKPFRIPAGLLLTGFPPSSSITSKSYPNKEEREAIEMTAKRSDLYVVDKSPSKVYADIVGKDLEVIAVHKRITRTTSDVNWPEIQVNLLAWKVA